MQIEQDYVLCRAKFPALICRPIAAQFLAKDTIALFDFEPEETSLVVSSEKHYRLVAPDQLTEADLQIYRTRMGAE